MTPVLEFLQAIPYDQILIQTVNGIVTGMILALIASGLTLIFSMMGVLNFAHASFYMIGAYVAYSVAKLVGFWPGLVIAPILEQSLRQSLIMSNGNYLIFFSRPISLALMIFSIGLLVLMMMALKMYVGNRRGKLKVPSGETTPEFSRATRVQLNAVEDVPVLMAGIVALGVLGALEAMRTMGVPYAEDFAANANADLVAQSALITVDLKKAGIDRASVNIVPYAYDPTPLVKGEIDMIEHPAFEQYDYSLASAIAMIMGFVQLLIVAGVLSLRNVFYRGPVSGGKG